MILMACALNDGGRNSVDAALAGKEPVLEAIAGSEIPDAELIAQYVDAGLEVVWHARLVRVHGLKGAAVAGPG